MRNYPIINAYGHAIIFLSGAGWGFCLQQIVTMTDPVWGFAWLLMSWLFCTTFFLGMLIRNKSGREEMNQLLNLWVRKR